MKIALVEPFFSGSHKRWAKEYWRKSRHEIELLTLKGHHWKWRMHVGAVSLAKQFMQINYQPNLILATDMLDFGTFLGLTRSKSHAIATAIYFHENQITYPWSPTDKDVQLKRNNQYGFINYTSALAADRVLFNSAFHQQSFLDSLPSFLKQFPDEKNLDTIEHIASKCEVLHLGMDLKKMDAYRTTSTHNEAVLVWNHRWEYDKNPKSFFKALFRLQAEGIPFKLIVLGASYPKVPSIFAEAKTKLANHILHFGYVDDFANYAKWLWQADILPVTSHQDFFGGSVVEAIYCNCYPILPNRLAYVEHIPKTLHADYFYESEEAFYQKLKSNIIHIDKIRQKQLVANFVASYDWSNLVNDYDNLLEKI